MKTLFNKKIEKFKDLEWVQFVGELEKQKIKLGAKEKAGLFDLFEMQKRVLLELGEKIQSLDEQIEQKVRKLYDIS